MAWMGPYTAPVYILMGMSKFQPMVYNSEEKRSEEDERDIDNQAEGFTATTTGNEVETPMEELEEEPDIPCGLWWLTTSWLQRFRTPKWVLFGLCWAGALQGMVVNGFVNVNITTIEKRYGLRSSQTGLIAGAYDIASFMCLVPLTFYGGRDSVSKPKLIGIGVLIMGLGAGIFATPHFLAGPHHQEGTAEMNSLCVPGTGNSFSCDDIGDKTNELEKYMWVFFLGHFLHGVGSSPLYTLGVTYIDETVSTKMSSVYLGIFYTMAIVGPAIGYGLGGYFLSFYNDFLTVSGSGGLSEDSNVWVGAWWIGFLLTFILAIFVALPILAFPRHLPGYKRLQAQKISEAHGKKKQAPFYNLSDMPRALWALMRNPAFFFLNISAASEGLLVSGFAAFLPKFLENQFSITSQSAALIMGLITIPAGGGGTFLGGYLVKRYNLRCTSIIKFCIASTVVGMFFTLGFLYTCPNPAFAGVTQNYGNFTYEKLSLNSFCNSDCACSAEYVPTCGIDSTMYYSPCYAGCKEEYIVDGVKFYADCSCIPTSDNIRHVNASRNIFLRGTSPFSQAVNTSCESNCDSLIPFLIFIVLVMLCTFTTSMPALSATLRVVQDDQRSFALGIQWLIVRLIGTIPSPIIFGLLIDRACILWQDTCDDNGACLVYDNAYLSYYMMFLALVGKTIGVVGFAFACHFYIPPPVDPITGEPELKTVDKQDSTANENETTPLIPMSERPQQPYPGPGTSQAIFAVLDPLQPISSRILVVKKPKTVQRASSLFSEPLTEFLSHTLIQDTSEEDLERKLNRAGLSMPTGLDSFERTDPIWPIYTQEGPISCTSAKSCVLRTSLATVSVLAPSQRSDNRTVSFSDHDEAITSSYLSTSSDEDFIKDSSEEVSAESHLSQVHVSKESKIEITSGIENVTVTDPDENVPVTDPDENVLRPTENIENVGAGNVDDIVEAGSSGNQEVVVEPEKENEEEEREAETMEKEEEVKKKKKGCKSLKKWFLKKFTM